MEHFLTTLSIFVKQSIIDFCESPGYAFKSLNSYTSSKVSKYGVFSGPNTKKYGPEKTPYLDTFHAVLLTR